LLIRLKDYNKKQISTFFTLLVLLGFAYFPVPVTSQTAPCYDANGHRYEDGQKLGPYQCRNGKWVYGGS
jgi:hypothetical protein